LDLYGIISLEVVISTYEQIRNSRSIITEDILINNRKIQSYVTHKN
jgi:hypothetical protein